ncbi:O-antigen ligase family protein [Litorivicinus sp.]|nr:O-antigen ligase family protein [Litorivicinus sp.]
MKRAAVFTLIVTAGSYMFFSWAGYLGYVSLDRLPSELLENHATQGVIFATTSLLMLIMLKTDSLPIWGKLGFCLLIVGMVTNIIYVLTGRTSYVALLLLAPYGAWVVASRLKWLFAAVVLVVISLALYNSDTANSRVVQGLNEFETTIVGEAEAYTSMGIRWVFWENTLRMIATKPLLGSGSGGFSQDYARMVADDEGWRATVTDDPHQQYLLIAGEQGLVGLSLFLAILVVMLVSRGDDSYRLGAFGILVMTAVNGMFNGHFGTFVEGRLFWTMMGVLLCSTTPLRSFEELKYGLSEFISALGAAFGVKVDGK